MNVTMTRQQWKSFREFIGLKKTEHPTEYPKIDFIYRLEPHERYPRIHFNCQYGTTHVIVDFHMDLSPHNSIYRHPYLMQFHKTMNDWKEIHPSLIKLKRLREDKYDKIF